jgi:hypothetical protein
MDKYIYIYIYNVKTLSIVSNVDNVNETMFYFLVFEYQIIVRYASVIELTLANIRS